LLHRDQFELENNPFCEAECGNQALNRSDSSFSLGMQKTESHVVIAKSQLPVISVRGDAYSRGLKLGSEAKERIIGNVNYYLYLWKTYSHLERDWVLLQSGRFRPMIKKYDPDILDEMQGIAEGSGVSLEEIIALNCRYEFVWAKMSFDAISTPSPVGECTALGATPEATKDGHTLVGQNWDYKPKVRENCIILEEIQEPEKPNIVMHTEAGIIGQKGMNSSGIGVVVNALVSDQDKYEPKTPFWVMVRGALNQRTLDRALLAITGTDRTVSGNLMIGQEGGEIIDLESTPFDVGFMYPQGGILSHANNFVDLRYARNVVDKFKNIVPDSLIRTERAGRLLRKHAGSITVGTLKEALKDHFGYPNSICRHPDPAYHVDLQAESIASVVMDLENRTLHVSNGEPCSNPYKTFKFDSLASGTAN
jgi:isopenicillin-N N-acyltransferase-like protein